jgi:hypothetical protein
MSLVQVGPPWCENYVVCLCNTHNLYTLDVRLNEGALATMSQLMSCCIFPSFSLHTWLANLDVVLFPVLMSDWCLLYLVLLLVAS